MLKFPHPSICSLVIAFLAVAMLVGSGLAEADTYTYDAYGRLLTVTYSDGSSVTYSYDAAGNRTAVTATP